MKNAIKTFDGKEYNFNTAAGIAGYIAAAGKAARKADSAFSIAAPFALFYATGEKDSNLDPINRLFSAMALKAYNGNLSVNQKKLVTFVRLWADEFLTFDKNNKNKPFGYKKAGRNKSGKTKFVPVEKRVLKEGFTFTLDFRTCEKADPENRENKPVTLKQVKGFIDKSLKATAEKTASISNALAAMDEGEEKESTTVDLYASLLDMVFNTVPHELIAVRLEAETGVVATSAESDPSLTITEEAAASSRGDTDAANA